MILGTGTANFTLKEELRGLPTIANFATVQEEGGRKVSRNVEHYILDMILSVGYRVKSQNGILFRQWANQVLKDIQNIHDRFIIVDETVYHIGSSLNELGKKLTAFSVLNFISKQQLLEMVAQASGIRNN